MYDGTQMKHRNVILRIVTHMLAQCWDQHQRSCGNQWQSGTYNCRYLAEWRTSMLTSSSFTSSGTSLLRTCDKHSKLELDTSHFLSAAPCTHRSLPTKPVQLDFHDHVDCLPRARLTVSIHWRSWPQRASTALTTHSVVAWHYQRQTGCHSSDAAKLSALTDDTSSC
jgi:hypothetical protein